MEITPTVVKRYQMNRLTDNAGPKTINDEVLLLLRLCGDQGDLIRAKLRREKSLKLKLPPSPGRAYTADEKARMLAEAAKLRSRNMYPALVVDLNCGLRDKELRELRWQQIDLVHKKQITVGKSKTDAGTGRVIPLNDTVMIALEAHAAWYIRRFGECRPEWYVFPAGKGQPNDPTRPVTTLRTAWTPRHGEVVRRTQARLSFLILRDVFAGPPVFPPHERRRKRRNSFPAILPRIPRGEISLSREKTMPKGSKVLWWA